MNDVTAGRSLSQRGDIRVSRFASSAWKEDIVGAPAMIMALGLFLVYPGRYTAHQLLPGATAALTPGMLFVLALAVMAVNILDLGRQMAATLRFRRGLAHS